MLAAVASEPWASDAILLSEEAGGILELEDERRLEVSGFRGSIALRLGKLGELRFAARNLTGERVKRPVALWLDGSTLRIVPTDDAAGAPVRLEISMSSTLSARVSAVDSQIHISGLHGEVEVRGERLDLTLRTVDGSVDVEIEKGTVLIEGVAEELTLAGSELEGRVQRVTGALTVRLEDSLVESSGVQGGLDADLDETEFSLASSKGRVRVEAERGSLQLRDCRVEAELLLSETPLGLYQTEGSIEVDTDAEVVFDGHNGPLHIRGIGSAVRGARTSGGLLEIETSGAEVLLEALEGSTMIRGADLEIQVKESKGELTVTTTASTIVVESPESTVSIENDFGDIRVQDAVKLVKIDSRDGEVRLFGIKGPVDVSAEGPEVEVIWASLGGAETSSVENSRGDVRVTLPSKFRCRIDASAPHGRIEADLKDLQVTDDGHHASGILMGGHRPAAQVKKPTIRLKSGGDVYIDTTDPLSPGP
jgi:hypothetical protein